MRPPQRERGQQRITSPPQPKEQRNHGSREVRAKVEAASLERPATRQHAQRRGTCAAAARCKLKRPTRPECRRRRVVWWTRVDPTRGKRGSAALQRRTPNLATVFLCAKAGWPRRAQPQHSTLPDGSDTCKNISAAQPWQKERRGAVLTFPSPQTSDQRWTWSTAGVKCPAAHSGYKNLRSASPPPPSLPRACQSHTVPSRRFTYVHPIQGAPATLARALPPASLGVREERHPSAHKLPSAAVTPSSSHASASTPRARCGAAGRRAQPTHLPAGPAHPPHSCARARTTPPD